MLLKLESATLPMPSIYTVYIASSPCPSIFGSLSNFYSIFNPRCAVPEDYDNCYVCVNARVCMGVSVRSFRTCRSRNIGTNGYTLQCRKNFLNHGFCFKNASFRSDVVIFLPRMPPTTHKSQKTDTKGISGR